MSSIERYTNGSLELVAGQNPDLEVRPCEVHDGVGDAHLQLVLDGSCAKEDEVLLYHFCCRCQLLLSANKQKGKYIVMAKCFV